MESSVAIICASWKGTWIRSTIRRIDFKVRKSRVLVPAPLHTKCMPLLRFLFKTWLSHLLNWYKNHIIIIIYYGVTIRFK